MHHTPVSPFCGQAPYHTLITAQQLYALQQSGQPLYVMDVSFDLAQPAWGQQQFATAHIPGAHYIHLDEHLSSHNPATQASGGRHPLPARAEFADTLARLGVQAQQQIVVYDRNGCNFCGRAWWMLQWLGHGAAAVLDGGLQAWQQAGYAVESGDAPPAAPAPTPFPVKDALVALHSADDVARLMQAGTTTLLDGRAAARYRGEVEPLDRTAGHIPGAWNRPFGDNLGVDGHFKPSEQLRAELQALISTAGGTADAVTVYCGSGVSAIPTILAMRTAGLPTPALFAGSWSEWSASQPARPVATGAEPGRYTAG